MPLKVKRPTEVRQRDYLVTTIYGQPGAGKTTLSLLMGQNVLHFDMNKGGGLRAATYSAGRVEPESWKEIVEGLSSPQDFQQLRQEYDTVVFDTADELVVDMLGGYLKERDSSFNTKKGELQWYGAIKKEFKTWFELFRKYKFNIIFIAHQKEDSSITGNESFYKPLLTGSSYDLLMSLSDIVCYVYVKQGQHFLSMSADWHFFKNPGNLPAQILIPKPEGDTFLEFDQMAKSVIKDTLRNMNKRSQLVGDKYLKMQQEAAAAKANVDQEFDEMLAAIKTPEGMDQAAAYIVKKKAEYTADMLRYIQDKYKATITALGYRRNPETGKYYDPQEPAPQAAPQEPAPQAAPQAAAQVPGLDLQKVIGPEGGQVTTDVWLDQLTQGLILSEHVDFDDLEGVPYKSLVQLEITRGLPGVEQNDVPLTTYVTAATFQQLRDELIRRYAEYYDQVSQGQGLQKKLVA